MTEKAKPTPRKKREKTEATLRVGSRIKSLRTSQRLSQAQVAERAGLSSKYLGEVERGEANLSIELVNRIAKALNVPFIDLLENEHERPHQELIDEITRMAAKLDHKDAKIAYRMLKAMTE